MKAKPVYMGAWQGETTICGFKAKILSKLQQKVMGRVEHRIEEIGTTQALSILTDYYNRDDGGNGDGASAMDGLVADLRKRVRAYSGELQQTQRVVGQVRE